MNQGTNSFTSVAWLTVEAHLLLDMKSIALLCAGKQKWQEN